MVMSTNMATLNVQKTNKHKFELNITCMRQISQKDGELTGFARQSCVDKQRRVHLLQLFAQHINSQLPIYPDNTTPTFSDVSSTTIRIAALTNTMINFLDLPGEIRNLIYDHLLAFDEPIAFWAKEKNLPVKLLYVNNKTIHREFSSLFYSRITFDFSARSLDSEDRPCSACLTKRTTSFLDQIGQNARYVQCIKIDFPNLNIEDYEQWSEASISEYSVEVVNKIASSCPNLRELTLGPNLTLNALLHLAVVEPDETLELLHRVDCCIRKIPSLDLMIWVKVPDCDEYYGLVEEMESVFGWDVELIDPLDFEWMTDDEEDEDGDEDDEEDDEEEEEDDDDDDDDEDDDDADGYEVSDSEGSE